MTYSSESELRNFQDNFKTVDVGDDQEGYEDENEDIINNGNSPQYESSDSGINILINRRKYK